jgi:glycosyltransferase involved in cell wall biosynthesis
MKIVHVETGRHFYGGAQQVIWLMQGLALRGVENLLVCPPNSAIDRIARDANLPVENLACNGDLDFRFALKLRQLARRERPDIVHCHSRRGADFPGGYALLLTGIPALLSRRVDHTEAAWLARLRYRPFAKVIAISEHVAEVLRKTGVGQKKLEVIRSAVDAGIFPAEPDYAAFREEFLLDDGDFVIAMVAQFILRKGHRFLFDVIPKLRESYPNIRVVLFGRGPDEKKTRELAETLSLEGTVQFAGFRDDLDKYLPCFDLLVHPALHEGLGVAMLKAAAAGVPVLAFDTAGAREVVVHGKTGVLVPVGDLVSLQKAIAVLIDEPGMRREFGQAGRQRMIAEFGVGKMVEKHIEIYQAIIHG